jgi:hypothetical protein
MTKRNPGLARNPRDFYPTPAKAVEALLPWLQEEKGKRFAEPCCGKRDLINHLMGNGYLCTYAADISMGLDVMQWMPRLNDFDFTCTNPPWHRPTMHEMILHLVRATAKPVWLLIDADWMHTKQAAPYIGLYCTHIVSIGRVRWMEGTTMDGYDNSAWYRFKLNKSYEYPVFIPRSENDG